MSRPNMSTKALVKNISQAYVMSKYLADLCKVIGKEAYMNSAIRKEHGTGTGFFGISNTGSTDCVKERLRHATDSLGQKFDRWQQIQFVSQGCLGMTERNKFEHRVEHTRECIDLFKAFENDYIISGRNFIPNDLGIWLIENHIVCLILQREQRKQSFYNDNKPFSKYSGAIYYQNQDISHFSLEQVKVLNKQRFANQIEEIKNFNFTSLIDHERRSLLMTKKKHTLPPIDIAIKFHDNEFELLERHYTHKLNKRTNSADKKWYCVHDTARFNIWKNKNEKI